jgi:hypothetical protein
MCTYTIHVDGNPYQGEDPEATYPANIGGGGWHVPNHHALNALRLGKAGEPAKRIVSNRGLQTEMERIIRRITDGKIDCETITIKREGGNHVQSI